ncbi:MAG TPA: nucleotide exchange factor GrpE [Candidatus Angelobacter sp.]|nr:nucleotide exchange factor GrpE [Candidatus Angelobacter sp.]
MRTNDQNVLKQTHEALAGLENRIQAVEQEDLESYFDKWKSHGLEPQLQSAAAQTLKNFTSDPENEKTLHDSVAVLKKVLETAGPWFDAITSCIRALPATQENGAWNEFSIRLQKYCESGAELRQRAQKAIAQSDLSREPAGVVGNLSFFDIASGGSARSISHDYENRLADRLQQVQSTAAEAAQQWQALRDELMKLLDHLDATGSAAGQSHQVSQLETQLRSTLRPLKFQEIPVETNSTVFDPSLHEAIAGGAVARPELPENTIIRLERRGFFYEGKVLRRALVAVSSRG